MQSVFSLRVELRRKYHCSAEKKTCNLALRAQRFLIPAFQGVERGNLFIMIQAASSREGFLKNPG
jgi:hypothetical protein